MCLGACCTHSDGARPCARPTEGRDLDHSSCQILKEAVLSPLQINRLGGFRHWLETPFEWIQFEREGTNSCDRPLRTSPTLLRWNGVSVIARVSLVAETRYTGATCTRVYPPDLLATSSYASLGNCMLISVKRAWDRRRRRLAPRLKLRTPPSPEYDAL